MEKTGYRIIRSNEQYMRYCDMLEELVDRGRIEDEDEIELLTLLIEKYDEEQMPGNDLDPIALLKLFMKEHRLKSKDLAKILKVNKSTVSRMLNYQKGLSKNSIRILSKHFAISQEALNRSYKLKNKINRKFKNASLMNAEKKIKSGEHPG